MNKSMGCLTSKTEYVNKKTLTPLQEDWVKTIVSSSGQKDVLYTMHDLIITTYAEHIVNEN